MSKQEKNKELSMEAMVNQLGDSADFTDLKQKMSTIENSKVFDSY
jgi:hypothetical protein